MFGADTIFMNGNAFAPAVVRGIVKRYLDIVVLGTLGAHAYPVGRHIIVVHHQRGKIGPVIKPVFSRTDYCRVSPATAFKF